MVERDFEDVYNELCESFSNTPDGGETNLEVSERFLDFILERERLRHRITRPGADRDRLDDQTLDDLKNPDQLGPEHSREEVVFRRLVNNPESALRYLEDVIEAENKAQSQRAKKPRPRARDGITRSIEDILEHETKKLSSKEVGRELEQRQEIGLIDDEYQNLHDGSTLKVANLASRVWERRKRVSG